MWQIFSCFLWIVKTTPRFSACYEQGVLYTGSEIFVKKTLISTVIAVGNVKYHGVAKNESLVCLECLIMVNYRFWVSCCGMNCKWVRSANCEVAYVIYLWTNTVKTCDWIVMFVATSNGFVSSRFISFGWSFSVACRTDRCKMCTQSMNSYFIWSRGRQLFAFPNIHKRKWQSFRFGIVYDSLLDCPEILDLSTFLF